MAEVITEIVPEVMPEVTPEAVTLDTEILETVTQMSDSLKQEVLHYAKYLLENYLKSSAVEVPPKKRRLSGSMKGTFVLPLPDNFDDPLEEFAEYM